MSHFTILVIGENIEGQLAPYDEGIQVKPYKVRLDDGDYELDANRHREYMKERKANHDQWVADGKPNLEGLLRQAAGGGEDYWKYRGIQEIEVGTYVPLDVDGMTDDEVIIAYGKDESVNKDDEGWYRMSQYNPDSQWDWYVIGGRWAGFFKVKPGARVKGPNISGNPFSAELAREELEHFRKEGKLDGLHTDQARKGDIDFDGMRADAARKAGENWDAYQAIVKGTPEAEAWDDVRERFGATDSNDEGFRDAIDKAREFYHSQPRVQALREAPDFFFANPEDFQVSRDAFTADAAARALGTYAVVKDGEWYSRGKMGWWGMSRDDESLENWTLQVNDLLDSLPDDTLLTLIDAHI